MVAKLNRKDIAALLGVTIDANPISGKSVSGEEEFRKIKYNGEYLTATEIGIEFATTCRRVWWLLRRGFTDEEIISILGAHVEYQKKILGH
jgi:hypothetical protein